MGNKLYYTIKEVSEMLEIEQSTLRFWEKNFPQIVPQRSMGNHRMYTLNEIEQVKVINYLLKEKKMKIEGAQTILKKDYDKIRKEQIISDKLKCVKKEIVQLRKEFMKLSKESELPDNIQKDID